MLSEKIIENLTESFSSVVPKSDKRVNISHLQFVVFIVFHFLGDAKQSSLASIRRFMIAETNTQMSRGAFWERLAGNRFKKIMESLVEKLMSNTIGLALISSDILRLLKVTGVLLIDSSTIKLSDDARRKFPGTRSKAGIKWHACFDLFSGQLKWFKLTASKVHDRKCFPDVELIKGKIIIYDLGYFDYQLIFELITVGAFFLCRLKSNSVVTVQAVISGLSRSCVGQSLLSSCNLNRYRGKILEAVIEKESGKNILSCRAVGFWNPDEKRYHWYLTNLLVPAVIIYSLYRLRWQIELIFKSCKNSLNADALPSADPNIIESLLLASIAAHLSSQSIHEIALNSLSKEEGLAVSFQRTAYVFSVLKNNFINCILNPIQENIEIITQRIRLMINELYDPNYRKRETSKAEIYRRLMDLNTA
jgi:hypothetical protein